MSWWKKVSKFFGMITVRNRDARGRYVADDPSTPDRRRSIYKSLQDSQRRFQKEKDY